MTFSIKIKLRKKKNQAWFINVFKKCINGFEVIKVGFGIGLDIVLCRCTGWTPYVT